MNEKIPGPPAPEDFELRLRKHLQSFGYKGLVEWHSVLASTQTRAHELGRGGIAEAAVATDEQTAGRGRLNRRWESPKGSGLYMSLLYRPVFSPATAHLANIAAALAVEEAVRTHCGLALQLKWPNDLLLEGRKVCGILSESVFRGNALDYCITGIGINMRKPSSLPVELERRFGWLVRTGEGPERTAFLADVVDAFSARIRGMENEGHRELLELYRKRCASVGRTIRVETEDEEILGRCTGIGDDGELLLETLEGTRRFHVADVTHAGLDGPETIKDACAQGSEGA